MVVEKSEIGLSSERHVFYKQYLNDWECTKSWRM